MPEAALGVGPRPHRRDARVPRRGLHHAGRRSRRPAASATPPTRPERLERLAWALDRTRGAGPVRPDAPRRVPARARRPRPHGDARHPGPGRPVGRGEGGHARLRDRPGDRRLAPPDARRPEGAQPQGQLRPGQHAPLRHGRPDPRRRDPRPRHPERPRQGRPAADHPGGGARKSRSARARSTSASSSGPSSASATPARSSSSARSATRPAGSATSRTAWRFCMNAWPNKVPACGDRARRWLKICVSFLCQQVCGRGECLHVVATFLISGGHTDVLAIRCDGSRGPWLDPDGRNLGDRRPTGRNTRTASCLAQQQEDHESDEKVEDAVEGIKRSARADLQRHLQEAVSRRSGPRSMTWACGRGSIAGCTGTRT